MSFMLQVLAAVVKAASSVAVVGGGPSGVELAGEIVTVRAHVGRTGQQLSHAHPCLFLAAVGAEP